jgi:imidazolonepropionase-like amidohydrolase
VLGAHIEVSTMSKPFIAALCFAPLWWLQPAFGQSADALGPEVQQFARVNSPKVVLEHVRVIDGTGSRPSADRNIVIKGGKIVAIGAGADVAAADGTTILHLRGDSVLPGIVNLHGHVQYYRRPNLQEDGKYDRPSIPTQMVFSAPRLYLANGTTTMRTAGSISPLMDVNLKRLIEKGVAPGPHLDVTGPFMTGPGATSLQTQMLMGPEDASQTVAFWADRGVTSFKAYVDITRAELRAMVVEAHKRGLKVLGHLCSVTYEEAAEAGIDSLEHGFFTNTQLDPGKQPDKCSDSRGEYTLEHMTAEQANQLIATLVSHHVAVTSTLPSTAFSAPSLNASPEGGPLLRAAALSVMSPSARAGYLIDFRRVRASGDDSTKLFRREMELERAFVAAGGLLMAGSDPVGLFGSVPGFADHREIELLVAGGFKPLEAIRIATLNGAIFLGRQDRIGSVAVGKNADLLVVKGDPSAQISDIENVDIVFKDGVGYDTKKLLASVQGLYGEY